MTNYPENPHSRRSAKEYGTPGQLFFSRKSKTDTFLGMTIFIVSLIGIFCLFSVTVSKTSTNLISKQFACYIGGLVIMTVVSYVSTEFYKLSTKKLDMPVIPLIIIAVGIITMAACLIYNRGADIKRSLPLGNFLSFEPSEILKIGSILYIAYFCDIYRDKLSLNGLSEYSDARGRDTSVTKARLATVYDAFRQFGRRLNATRLFRWISDTFSNGADFFDDSFFWHLILAFPVGVSAVMIALSSHLSALTIFTIVSLFMLLRGNAKPKYLISGMMFVIIFGVPVYLLVSNNYQMDRFMLFHYEPVESQQMNALFAIASGGFTGKGYLNTSENFGYLAESNNDFIYSIVCEEFGFVGAVFVIAAFAVMCCLIYRSGKNALEQCEGNAVKGIAVLIATQTLLHILVNTSLVPNTGISLPFFSSGGTSLVITFAEMGFVLGMARREATDIDKKRG